MHPLVVPLLIATILAGHGYRKRSLSPSGAAAAFIVGLAMLSVPLKTFGISMIVFYLIGSRATKMGKERKQKLEEGVDLSGGGYRTAAQVLSNSLTASIAAAAWAVLFTPDSIHSVILSPFIGPGVDSFRQTYNSANWCAADSTGLGLSRPLVFIALGHFACCLGDTLASELGILASSPPILITTLRKVPPGTNGGLSLLGTSASVAGGAIIGLTYTISLSLESTACRGNIIPLAISLTAWGAFAGGIGSLIDSIAGATLQQTRYNPSTKRIVAHASKSSQTGVVISGIDLLTNNQVNVVASLSTAILVSWLAN